MAQRISELVVTVRGYDEAIAFYVDKLGFELLEDTDLGGGKRWVRVKPRGAPGTAVLLARATSERQLQSVGNQAGGRVFAFVETDDFARDFDALASRGVRFTRAPRAEPYGTVAVFEDLYGNPFDLIERRPSANVCSRSEDATPPGHGARWLYLHGFASGPGSAKGAHLARHYAGKGIHLERLDLRRPSMEHLRLSTMIAHVREAIGGPRDRAVVFGSSLGGLTAARVAEEDARVSALVLLAPAFGMSARWRARLGEAGWEKWRTEGYLETKDHAHGGVARVDFGFAEDVATVDARGGGVPDVRVPTLVIHGTGDDVVPVEGSRRWAKGRRNVRLVEVDDGHELVASQDLIAREADAHLEGFLGREG